MFFDRIENVFSVFFSFFLNQAAMLNQSVSSWNWDVIKVYTLWLVLYTWHIHESQIFDTPNSYRLHNILHSWLRKCLYILHLRLLYQSHSSSSWTWHLNLSLIQFNIIIREGSLIPAGIWCLILFLLTIQLFSFSHVSTQSNLFTFQNAKLAFFLCLN